eukprot:gene5999-7126_t
MSLYCGRDCVCAWGVYGCAVTRNLMRTVRSTHSNAVSVYLDSSEVLFAGNVVLDANIDIAPKNGTTAWLYRQ